MFTRLVRFFSAGIWVLRLDRARGVGSLALRILRSLILAARGFVNDECALKASALTYFALLAIVPVAALLLGIAKGFGLEAYIRRALEQQVQWQTEIAEEISRYAYSLLSSARGGVIAGFGLLLLIYAVVQILGSAEASFNQIWGVRAARLFRRKVTDYLSVLLVAPILLFVSSSATISVAAGVRTLVRRGEALAPLAPLATLAMGLIPYVFTWALLAFLFGFLPNTRVRFSSALLAGAIAGTLFQLVQYFYLKLQIGVAHYNAVYGSLAALPLFMVWLHASWMIVLFGAEISCAYQNGDTYGFHPDYGNLGLSERKFLAALVMYSVLQKFERGEPPGTLTQLSRELEIPLPLVRDALRHLQEARLVSELKAGGGTDAAYQPGIDPARISVKRVSDAYERAGSAAFFAPGPSVPGPVQEKIAVLLGRYAPDDNAPLKDL